MRWVPDPGFRALILRRESTQLGDLIDKSLDLYPRAFPGAKFNGTLRVWTFPSGAKIRFGHCEHEQDVAIYDGLEFQLIEFDELTHFEEAQYLRIRARIRSSRPGLPRYTRSSTNPGGHGHEWVFKRWRYWLDPEFECEGLPVRTDPEGNRLPPAAPGQVLWLLPSDGGEVVVPPGTRGALTRQFIPSTVRDNPRLVDPEGYGQQLADLDPVRRRQLRDGDWLVKPSAGLYFKRHWFKVVDKTPDSVIARVRYWDRASTEGGGDYTAGVRLAKLRDLTYVVEDVQRFQRGPAGVEAAIRQCALDDPPGTLVGIEQDPGQAGKFESNYYVLGITEAAVKAFPKRVDKVTAAGPFSSKVESGAVAIVDARWNKAFLEELEAFPDGKHDDQVDAASGAFGALSYTAPTVKPSSAGSKRWNVIGRGF